jgi:hypothetical protein
LNTVVKGFKGLGYDFIKPCSLGTCPDITPSKNFEIPRAATGNTEIEQGECPVATLNSGGENSGPDSGGGNTGLSWLLALFGISLVRKRLIA